MRICWVLISIIAHEDACKLFLGFKSLCEWMDLEAAHTIELNAFCQCDDLK